MEDGYDEVTTVQEKSIQPNTSHEWYNGKYLNGASIMTRLHTFAGVCRTKRYTTSASGRWGESGTFILLKLSAVNLITKPPMSVQVMYPPPGMSVTGSEFVKSGACIYMTTFTLKLPIKVRKEAAPREDQTQTPNSNPSIAGFEAIISMIGIFLVSSLRKKW
jgi:hypothetical protein